MLEKYRENRKKKLVFQRIFSWADIVNQYQKE